MGVLPTTRASVAWAAGSAVALTPNMLPRSPVVSVATMMATGSAACLLALVIPWRGNRWARALAMGCAATVGAVSTAVFVMWQNQLRVAFGEASFGSIGAVVLVLLATSTPLWAHLGGQVIRAHWAAIRERVVTAVGVIAVAVAAVAGNSMTAPVAGATPLTQAERFQRAGSPAPGTRVYVALTEAATAEARAQLAVDRLLASGGLRAAAITIAFPTGSGWVDDAAVAGVERSLPGASVVVAVQYSSMPSWQAFVLQRNTVALAGSAIIAELARRLPANAPPIQLYGQSLGALGVIAARAEAARVGLPIAGSVVAGLPDVSPRSAGSRDPDIGGAVALSNPSDPVVRWSLALAYRAPHLPPARVGHPTPQPGWLPLATFVQFSVDLIGSQNAPMGFGHRYDQTQGTALVSAASQTRDVVGARR